MFLQWLLFPVNLHQSEGFAVFNDTLWLKQEAHQLTSTPPQRTTDISNVWLHNTSWWHTDSKTCSNYYPSFHVLVFKQVFHISMIYYWLMSPYAHQQTPAGCCCSNQRNIKALKTVFQSVWTLNAISWYLCIKDDSATFINQNLIPDDRLFSTEALNIVNIVGQTPSPPFFLVVPSHSWRLYVC